MLGLLLFGTLLLGTLQNVPPIGMPGETLDASRRQDVYAIYSRMISSDDEIYLIESTTLTQQGGYGSLFRPGAGAQPYPPCVQAPPVDAAGLVEILADYGARKDVPAVLQREFAFNKPYQLLSRDEIRTFLEDALKSTPQVLRPGESQPSNSNPLFPRARRVFRLGDVYFNNSRTLALTYVSVLGTTMDGEGRWLPFKKTAQGQWMQAPLGRLNSDNWQVCGWSAGG
jgi:hypothetical protein